MNIFCKRKTELRFKLNPTATHLKPCNKVGWGLSLRKRERGRVGVGPGRLIGSSGRYWAASSPLLLLCTRADRKLIGQLLCLPDLRLAYWPVLVSPPRPQSPILSQYESMLQTSPSHQTHPPHFSSASSYSRHLASAALSTSARLGRAQLPEIYTICMRMSIKSTFPPGSPASAPPLFLTPGRSHLNPSHFQLSRAVPSNSRLQRKASSTRVLGSCCAAALPQSCFFVSPTQQSRAAGKAHSRRQGRCLTLDIQITLFP